MTTSIFINNKLIQLDPAQLIQAGGEGMVFGLDGGTAVKLYHQPTPQRAAKLRCLLDSGLAAQLPPTVLGPTALASDQSGAIVGFQMLRLPANSLPMKKLSNPLFWQQNNLQTTAVLPLLQRIHATLTHLHHLTITVGDLNDHNLFFTPSPPYPRDHRSPTPAFIDVDSYQFAHFPCPVAMPAFLDPALYHVTDFSRQSYFTPLTDWYAFAVLLVKSLLQVHPYGGVHKQHKSLTARAQAKVSVLDTAVTYPSTARHPDTLSDDLLHAIHRLFDKGERFPFPAHLLADYAAHLTTCPHCGINYPANRRHCPACRLLTPATEGRPPLHPRTPSLLLRTDGFIEHVAVQPNGRILAIVREGDCYKLIRLGVGGKLDEMVLFNGRPGYRFAVFGSHLAVNPPHSGQLLVLDISGGQPQKVTMLETALFKDTAVFAATPRHLYRIAGTWIMRGTVRDGLYVEDAIATAHRNQTRFWASPLGETLAGYHRIFAEYRFFLIHEGSSCDIPIPPLGQGESLEDTAVTFTAHTVTLQRTIGQRGQQRRDATTCDFRGRISRFQPDVPIGDDGETATTSTVLSTSSTSLSAGVIHPHPAGQLIQEPSALYLKGS